MCGIGLVLSGVEIGGDAFYSEAFSQQHSRQVVETTYPDVEDLCFALKRRGPDHVGGAILHVDPWKQHVEMWEWFPMRISVNGRSGDAERLERETKYKEVEPVTRTIGKVINEGASRPSVPDMRSIPVLNLIGATLQLRGDHCVKQPLEDCAGNLLVFNGEIFDGLVVKANENDAEVLMSALCGCCGCSCHSSHLPSQCECTDGEFHQSVPQILSTLRGPWALIYWQAVSQTLWFGRDAIGRRSLLIHRPTANDPRLLLTSVAPNGREDKAGSSEYWEDLVCGIYSFAFTVADERAIRCANVDSPSKPITHNASRQKIVAGSARKHNWEDPLLRNLLAWEREHVTPNNLITLDLKSDQLRNREQQDVKFLECEEGQDGCNVPGRTSECDLNDSSWQAIPRTVNRKSPVEQILAVLRRAVMRRTSHIRQHRGRSQLDTGEPTSTELSSASTATAPIAVLFSGGLDSMILAALADQFVDSEYTIDLLNVSFEGASAPDRITAVAGVAELKGVFPLRRWRLVEVDAKWSDLEQQRGHLQSLICPSNTYMDLNIGTALWLASSGNGRVRYSPASDVIGLEIVEEGSKADSGRQESEVFHRQDTGASCTGDLSMGNMGEKKCQFRSEARILLVGSGADEQCGGYGRHRTKFRLGGWTGLEAEMRLDFSRIWKRNLGRDDRCIADLGKEARFPFLDEDVISTLLSIPLWDIVDLQQPCGVGDKKILRQVAMILGLKGAAVLPKRAIQFGSRIAQASNCRDFGSNRAANLASAGSAILKPKEVKQLSSLS